MLRTFLKNPLGTLSTIHQLRSIPIGIGLLDPLVELLVKPVREEQQVNNPYTKASQPDLYDAFAVSRYERYVTGRMASLLALKGGGKVLKASKYTDELQTFVRNARIGKLADIVNDDVPAAPVGVSVGDEDRTRVVQESDSAGSAVRQNERFQRNDGDASDVPDGQADEIVAYSQKGNRVALDGDYS